MALPISPAALDPTLLSAGQTVVEVLGTTAFAVSAVISAARRKLDAVGVVAVATLAAFGGGTVRDILLDRRPLFWIEQDWMLWLVFALAIVSMSALRSRHFEYTERVLLTPDALGLGLFAASGTQIALQMEMPLLISAIMGMITAVVGGVLRDIVCNDIPQVFQDHRPYALCAFAGAWALIGCQIIGLPNDWSLIIGALAGFTLRMLAIWLDWRLPSWQTD